MSARLIVSACALLSCVLVAVPISSSERRSRVAHASQEGAATIDVSGLWQTMTVDVRYPFNTTQCVPSGGGFRVRDPEKDTPWTFSFSEAGATLSGTVQQSGPMNACAPDPVPITDGAIEGDRLSFRVETPSGSTIEFVGVVQTDGTIAVTRSPVAPVAAAHVPNNMGPFSTEIVAYRQFVIGRVASMATNGCPDGNPSVNLSPLRRCEIADAQAPPFVAGTSEWMARDGVSFSPWIFDFTIGLHGVVTGSVRQGAVDPPTRTGPAPVGPFAITSGEADARRLSFTVKSADGSRTVTFSGVRRGKDAIDFHRSVAIVNEASPGSPLVDLFGPSSVISFTAVLTSDDSAAPAAAPSDLLPDPHIRLESVDDRAAAVPIALADVPEAPATPARPGFVLVRYDVQPQFDGSLFAVVLDTAGQVVRQFEVIATAGTHAALWDLRPANAQTGGGSITDQKLRIGDARAALVADAVSLATAVPNETARAGLSATLLDVLGEAPGADATPDSRKFVAPGNYTMALARMDGGAHVLLATRPLVVRASDGKNP